MATQSTPLVPTSLGAWTLEALIRLLDNHVPEGERFDFKASLPHPKNAKDKAGLRTDVAAFANSEGGFLIFGVRDDSSLPVRERLAGVPPSSEFREHFGSFPAECQPSVNWIPSEAPIVLETGNYIHVIEIPRSPFAPHAVCVDEKFIFPKRTNKGVEHLDYEEVKAMFLTLGEKLEKLTLLRMEIEFIKSASQGALEALRDEDGSVSGKEVSVITFSTDAIQRLQGELYPLLAPKKDLMADLFELRHQAQLANNKTSTYLPGLHVGNGASSVGIRNHNSFMIAKFNALVAVCDRAQSKLEST